MYTRTPTPLTNWAADFNSVEHALIFWFLGLTGRFCVGCWSLLYELHTVLTLDSKHCWHHVLFWNKFSGAPRPDGSLRSRIQVLEAMIASEVPSPEPDGAKESFKEVDGATTRKKTVAEGMLARAMYFPSNLGESQVETSDDNRASLCNPMMDFEDPSLLPPPPNFSDDGSVAVDDDILDDLDPAALAKFDSTRGPKEDVRDYFVCCQCLKEGYGEMDERDGNFYCDACWSEYMGVTPEAPGAGAADAPPPTSDDPTHPDYWENLKKNGGTNSGKGDVFAQFAREATTQLNTGTGGESAQPVPPPVLTPAPEQAQAAGNTLAPPAFEDQRASAKNLDVVVDAMLARIQDKRKSMRFDKAGKGKRFFKKKEVKKKLDVKKKKKKVDPKTLFASAPIGERGVLVKEPVNALPIPMPRAPRPKPLKPLRAVILFGEVLPDNTVFRSIYPYDDDTLDTILEKAFRERVCHAEADWAEKGLPVRQELSSFILDEFGGVVDTNTLSLAPPVGPRDYS